MIDRYILNEQGQPVAEADLMKWARWLETRSHCIVKQEWVEDVRVSTVFLGLDHNFSKKGPPVLWETMTFSNYAKFKYDCNRCAGNREQAEAMHERMVEKVKGQLKCL